jgi:hypothetical protein
MPLKILMRAAQHTNGRTFQGAARVPSAANACSNGNILGGYTVTLDPAGRLLTYASGLS